MQLFFGKEQNSAKCKVEECKSFKIQEFKGLMFQSLRVERLFSFYLPNSPKGGLQVPFRGLRGKNLKSIFLHLGSFISFA